MRSRSVTTCRAFCSIISELPTFQLHGMAFPCFDPSFAAPEC